MALILAATGCSATQTPEARSTRPLSPFLSGKPSPKNEAKAPELGRATDGTPVSKLAARGVESSSIAPASGDSDGPKTREGEPDKASSEEGAPKDTAPVSLADRRRVESKPTSSTAGAYGRATKAPAASQTGMPAAGPSMRLGAAGPALHAEEAFAASRPFEKGATVARGEAQVRAGEWDDNANYREFQKYLASEARLPFEKLDLSHRRFLVVSDTNGKGVVNCRITVRDAAQHEAVLTTTASGRALLFPGSLGLVGRVLSANAACHGHAQSMNIDTLEPDGAVEFRMPFARPAPSRTIDLVFVLDTTGSMAEEIDAVKDTISKVATEAGRGHTSFRVALVEYKDKRDAYVTQIHPFSTDIAAFSRQIQSIEASGGGDTPEHANEGLRVAIDQLDWSENASARLAFLIGDAPPHLDYDDDRGYRPTLLQAAARGIQLYTVAASGMDSLGQVVWRQLAQYTGGTNLFVLRGGAGPQSTGAGDPKASCGGTQSNYTSGNLDKLILAKLDLTQKLLELDPLRIAGLGSDENAKSCGQRIVMAR